MYGKLTFFSFLFKLFDLLFSHFLFLAKTKLNNMLQQDLIHHFHHYLDLLQKEIEAYEKDALLWAVVEGINNSGGNLCTHLLGNLNHFIGKNMGNTCLLYTSDAADE